MLNRLLFKAVLDFISRKTVMKDAMRKLLYAGHQKEEMDIELEGKKLSQVDSFVYLGWSVCRDGKTEREVRRRAQAQANAWRTVEGAMAYRRVSKGLNGLRSRAPV